jgi:hypothetical protein
MKESEYKYFTVSLLLRGHEEWFSYRVPHDTIENLRSLLTDPTNKHIKTFTFLALITSDGRRVIFRKSLLQQVHFLWDPLVQEPPPSDSDEYYDSIRIFYHNRPEPIGFEPLDIADVFQFSQDIELSDDGQTTFACIQDIDGEEVVVNAGALALLETPVKAEDAAMDRAEEEQREHERRLREKEE